MVVCRWSTRRAVPLRRCFQWRICCPRPPTALPVPSVSASPPALCSNHAPTFRDAKKPHDFPPAFVVATVVEKDARVAECAVARFLVVLADVRLIVEAVADGDVTCSTDGTLRSRKLVVWQLGLCLLYVLMISGRSAVDFGVLTLSGWNNKYQLFTSVFRFLLHGPLSLEERDLVAT